MTIDAHQHFWKYKPVRDAWMDASMSVIRKDFLPDDLEPILKENNIDGCVAVQSDQSEEETEFLLNLSKEYIFIKGVVGWVDIEANNVNERLEHFSKNKKFKGIRHILQAENEDFVLREKFKDGISKLEKFNLVYDILIYPNHLPNVIKLVSEFPNQLFVLDHIAKPYIKSKKIDEWKQYIKELSKCPNVHCKISGMVTEANWDTWEENDFNSYLNVIFDAFGIDRILFGSDWPVCLLAAEYDQVLGILKRYMSKFSQHEKNKIMGLNASKIYQLNL